MKCIKIDEFNDRCPKVDCGDKCSDVPFRKVEIPASMGDDTDGEYIPENGFYKNALVEYKANGALYIYSSDGIYTKLGYNTQGSGDVTKSYVDIQDNKTLSSAKAYTDDELNSLEDELKSFADAGDIATLRLAKTYTDTTSEEILQEAKDYTDSHSGQGGVSQQYVDQQDAATLTSAESFATTAAQNAAGTVQANLNTLSGSLSSVATTGLYSDLVGTPDVPSIVMTSTDPGEGGTLEENHFIAVYEVGSN